ncbi:MDR family MFS transporter [Nostocoides sp. HKS02]|uniref:MDR family MFS transporter n=1 Tax=Nostocoides sp. HKS02 TaxID=1813880 RepID=UPI001E36D235|nr:MDR family MFS transporter [Tetrasphaera sp. HKS02]
MAATAPARPDGPLTHRQIVTILVGLMMGMFLAALDQTIVATAIRTIADDLKGLDQQAWATTAYLITSTIVTPLYGKLSDIYGRKKFFSTAITIFVVGSILCTFATSMLQLAFFRAFQGLGAGGLFSLALAIIGDIVPPRERAKYQGYFLAVFGTSSVLGPVIGGFLAGQSSILGITGWRWVFLVNVPIGIAALLVVSRTLHLQHTRLDHRIDWWGAVTLSIGLVPLLLVAEQGRDWGWASGRSLVCFVVGGLGVIAFLLVERAMKDEALLPLTLFQERTVAVASGASVLIGMAMFGGLASLPLYLQIVKGASPTSAGLLLLPMTLGIMGGSIISGQIISRTGRYRRFPIIGSALLMIALVRVPLRARRHPTVGDDDRDGLLRSRPRVQLPAAHAGRPECRLTAPDRGGHLVGDLHPSDRWHARHRDLPVDPVHHGARQDHRGDAEDRPDQGLPDRSARPGQRGLREELPGGAEQWRIRRVRRSAPGLVVPEPPGPATGQAVPAGLLGLDGPGLPRRSRGDGARLPRDAAAAACRAARRVGLLRARCSRQG